MDNTTKEILWYYTHASEEQRALFDRLIYVLAKESAEARAIIDGFLERMKKGKPETEQEKNSIFEKMLKEAEKAAEGAPWCEWAIKSGWPELFSEHCG